MIKNSVQTKNKAQVPQSDKKYPKKSYIKHNAHQLYIKCVILDERQDMDDLSVCF